MASELLSPAAAHLQAWELADELVAVAGLRSRFDQSGPKCFRIDGDELVPEDYERLSSVRVFATTPSNQPN